MQPLRILNNVQKARLLHALFIHEIPAFLTYSQQLCTYMRENRDEVRKVWVNQLFGVDFSFQLAEEAERKIKRYGRQLEKSSAVFSDQLFDGYGALFLNHCLTTYAEKAELSDPKFRTAVELLFHP
ncbi:hypothetical protein SNE25_04105 [Mucilaginibacter sabulilitoris]|uniref:Uncharacterized protein n=1 Tax=Mucilaginibacter sabulilitoris TaxID=1173583 RepID=A0ABZ0TQG6_9SPHI|nr:hypothetical protein [Mucilaginibacter sabulilitoris]WPU94702.1 hypothetical protein SNE25_04105 [Mucilaginibacter sabulilitoris]